MFAVIRAICDTGTTVLLVEQNAFAALELCDYAYLLETGRIVLAGPGSTLIADPHVRQSLSRRLKRGAWIHACRIGALDGRAILPVFVAGRHLVLVRDGDGIFAAERACPHEGADLALGHCSGGRLFCPRHAAWFALTDGAVSPGWFFSRPPHLPDPQERGRYPGTGSNPTDEGRGPAIVTGIREREHGIAGFARRDDRLGAAAMKPSDQSAFRKIGQRGSFMIERARMCFQIPYL